MDPTFPSWIVASVPQRELQFPAVFVVLELRGNQLLQVGAALSGEPAKSNTTKWAWVQEVQVLRDVQKSPWRIFCLYLKPFASSYSLGTVTWSKSASPSVPSPNGAPFHRALFNSTYLSKSCFVC